jgi:hypothetical protein
LRQNQPTIDASSPTDGEVVIVKTVGLYLLAFAMFYALAWLALRTF